MKGLAYFELDDGALVVVTVGVLGCRENGDYLGEVALPVSVLRRLPIVHAVSFVLHLMRPFPLTNTKKLLLPDNAHQIVVRQKLRARLHSVNIGAIPIVVELELPGHASVFRFNGIRPEQVAK